LLPGHTATSFYLLINILLEASIKSQLPQDQRDEVSSTNLLQQTTY